MTVANVTEVMPAIKAQDQAGAKAEGDFMKELDSAVKSTPQSDKPFGGSKKDIADKIKEAVEDVAKDAIPGSDEEAAPEEEATTNAQAIPPIFVTFEVPVENTVDVPETLEPGVVTAEDVPMVQGGQQTTEQPAGPDAKMPTEENAQNVLFQDAFAQVETSKQDGDALAEQAPVTEELPAQHAEAAGPAPTAKKTETVKTDGKLTEPAQFAERVLQEADAALKQQETAKAGITENVAEQTESTSKPIEAMSDKGDAEEETGGKSQSGAKDQGITPMTAQISSEGKVEFKTSVQNQMEPLPDAEFKQNVQSQLLEQVKSIVTKDKTEFYIQLKPEHLGGLSIMLAAEEGGLVAKLMTANKNVHGIIQADQTQMLEALREKGINVVQMEVIYDQMGNSTRKEDANDSQQWENRSAIQVKGIHGGIQDIPEEMTMVYDSLTNYDVLAEQGGSVEFSA
ncbi:MAG: flagellar hook-length control protein FliK [Christensenellaceae bacterium]|jgi:flagellar hook-length control protein FliK